MPAGSGGAGQGAPPPRESPSPVFDTGAGAGAGAAQGGEVSGRFAAPFEIPGGARAALGLDGGPAAGRALPPPPLEAASGWEVLERLGVPDAAAWADSKAMTVGYHWRSKYCLAVTALSVFSAFTVLSALSTLCLLSIASNVSVLSIASNASVLSIGSSVSILSLGCYEGFMENCWASGG